MIVLHSLLQALGIICAIGRASPTRTCRWTSPPYPVSKVLKTLKVLHPDQHGPNSVCYCTMDCVIPPSWPLWQLLHEFKTYVNLEKQGSIGAILEHFQKAFKTRSMI
jgi:hypothetical protein